MIRTSLSLALVCALFGLGCGDDVSDNGRNGDVGENTPGTADFGIPTDGNVGSSDGFEDDRSSEPALACIVDEDCDQAGVICVNTECVSGCRVREDCEDDNPCTAAACVNAECVESNIQPDLPDDNVGDCRRPICEDGEVIWVAEATDLPAGTDDTACVVAECEGSNPVERPRDSFCRGDRPEDITARCVPGVGCVVPADLPPWFCETPDPGYIDEEICGDGQDNTGDGRADNDCPCEFGSVQRCFTGPPSARRVGQCTDGFQRCLGRDNPTWGPCEGGILPGTEACDGRDNSCNGCIDDVPNCDKVISCPGNDEVQPFRDYVLDAEELFEGIGFDYEWTVIPPSNSNTSGPLDPNAPVTSVFLDVSGDYLISLTIIDDKGVQFACSWIVSAQGVGLRGELVWDTFGSVDLDLHMHRGDRDTGFCTPDDCFYANCRASRAGGVDWGYEPSPPDVCGRQPGQICPNPRLDIDNIRGNDPENINIDNPNDGDSFRFMVHKFSGVPATRPVMTIYCGGEIAAVIGEAPDTVQLTAAGSGCQGDTWRVADVTMSVDEGTGATSCDIDILRNSEGDWDVRRNTSRF